MAQIQNVLSDEDMGHYGIGGVPFRDLISVAVS